MMTKCCVVFVIDLRDLDLPALGGRGAGVCGGRRRVSDSRAGRAQRVQGRRARRRLVRPGLSARLSLGSSGSVAQVLALIVRLTVHVDHTVQLSGVPAPPTVLKYPAAQAETAMVILVMRSIVRKWQIMKASLSYPGSRSPRRRAT